MSKNLEQIFATNPLSSLQNNDLLYVVRSGVDAAIHSQNAIGVGDVVGPASATDNALTRFDGTTGKLVQNSAAILDDSGNLTGLLTLNTSAQSIKISSVSSTIGAGQSCVIIGGDTVSIGDTDNNVGFGVGNTIGNGVGTSFISGENCSITGSHDVSAILTGNSCGIITSNNASITAGLNCNVVTADNSHISCGNLNDITSITESAVLCGTSNVISGTTETSSAVLCGDHNSVLSSTNSLIGAGSSNTIQASSPQCVILNGYNNNITGNSNGAILNGTQHNMTASTNSTITHGTNCTANTASGSLSGGSYATAAHQGVIVFTDSLQGSAFSSDVSDSWKSFFTNGYNLQGGGSLISCDLAIGVSSVGGIGQVVIASDRSAINAGASRAAIISSQATTISSSGEELFMAACSSSSITGGNFGFCFGSNSTISGNYNFAGILAVQSGTIDGSSNSLIASGGSHLISNSGFAAIVSGTSNSILSSSSQCVILNGDANVINANSNGVILNGTSHYLSSSTNSTITHGTLCNASAASGSLIGGSYATAAHAGVIVFTDSLQGGAFSSDTNDSWKSFFTNGYQLLGGGTVYSTPVQTITTSAVLTSAQWANRIIFNSGSAITITLPQQSTETTAAGVWFEYENIGAGDVTFVKEGAETLTGNTLCATGGSGKILRDTTTDWFNSGGTSVFTSTVTLFVQTVGNVTYNLAKMPGAGTFTNLHSICRSGTCTATFAIAGTNITATPNAVSTTNQDQSATAANTFTNGQYIQVTISANAACLDMTLGADYTYRVNI